MLSKDQALIQHHYYADGRFESHMWHDGQFRLVGDGDNDIFKNHLKQTVNHETYADKLDFATDSTMTIQWDKETTLLIFKKLPKKPKTQNSNPSGPASKVFFICGSSC